MGHRISWSALALSGLAIAAGALPAAAAAAVKCTDRTDDARRIELMVRAADTGKREKAFGYYAAPSQKPRGLVVFGHGHGNSAWKWRDNVEHVARRHGVIAVAMDYRRQTYPKGTFRGGESFGWRVREGAEDSIAAGKRFERRCLARTRRAERPPVVMFGVSMGGNASGLAVAAGAKRADGSPLFDHWFDIEGVANVTETYLEARMVAGPPVNNETGKVAVKEIEEAFGGSLERNPDVYRDSTVVTRAEDIRASGIQGVVMVHGFDDGTVPYNQSSEMFVRLAEQGIPTDFFTVARRGSGPSGNTLEETFGIKTAIPGYNSPFAGHGSENDRTHPVIRAGFDRLAAYFERRARPVGLRKFLIEEGTTRPQPE